MAAPRIVSALVSANDVPNLIDAVQNELASLRVAMRNGERYWFWRSLEAIGRYRSARSFAASMMVTTSFRLRSAATERVRSRPR